MIKSIVLLITSLLLKPLDIIFLSCLNMNQWAALEFQNSSCNLSYFKDRLKLLIFDQCKDNNSERTKRKLNRQKKLWSLIVSNLNTEYRYKFYLLHSRYPLLLQFKSKLKIAHSVIAKQIVLKQCREYNEKCLFFLIVHTLTP